MRILVLNGPNLNLLEKRDKALYGSFRLSDIENMLKSHFADVEFTFVQSNSEGELVNLIQAADKDFNGLIINPAAYSHYSIAIRDALELCAIPRIEVHLSNILAREDFRTHSVTAKACNGVICGLKETGYLAAAYSLKMIIENTQSGK